MSDPTEKIDAPRLPGDLSGRQIGSFRFLRRLGKGAMAEVYLAEQWQLKRWVAVKVLRPELAGDGTYLRRFELEAQAAAKLVHANIVQVHEVGESDGLHYIVQEYVQGQNLRDWIARNGPPLVQPALSIMRQIAAALAKAAEQGVVHRDIKPENIMITASGEVKVADFGLARVLSENGAAATALTQVGITMGTPLYMSPEQVEGRPLDHRSDLYSFGVLCYHLLTGKPPFTGDTALAVAVQHVKSQPGALETQRPDLPPALCRVVHQMLAKDPDQRWGSCRELLRELYRLQVTYCPQASPEEMSLWGSVGMEPLSDPRLRASRQLAEAMRGSAATRKKLTPWLVALSVAAMFALGGVTAWCTVRPPHLAPPRHSDKGQVPHEATQLRQWFIASRLGTEEAWQKVVDYSGAGMSDVVQLRAKQQLARIYLRADDFNRALVAFDELASVRDNYREIKAFGLAGKCGTLFLMKRFADSEEVNEQLLDYLPDLHDAEMENLARVASEGNRKELEAASREKLDKWLKERFNNQEGQDPPN